jgi:phosphatidylcholine synthase
MEWFYRLRAMSVHVYTASGIVVALLTVAAMLRGEYDRAFFWMVIAVLIDASDGTLARRWNVKRWAPHIDGRKLDDIVDYVNYTLVPLLLIGHAKWLPQPAPFWLAPPLIASLFAFAHQGAKEEDQGFFRGFPSYWNVVVFYLEISGAYRWSWGVVAVLLALSVLSVAPVRFVYPNRPPCWRPLFVGGALVWLAQLLLLLRAYPDQQPLAVCWSLAYPILYVVLSVFLDRRERLARRVD